MGSTSRTPRFQAHRERLRQRYRDLRQTVGRELVAADEERYADLAGRVHDLEDESVADLLVDIRLAVIDKHLDEIRSVEAALTRLDQGTYGRCADCGLEIAPGRLDVHPAAVRCVACQTRFEREHAPVRGPSL